MEKEKLYLSTVEEHAAALARTYGLGLELAEFCTAWNLDDEFPAADKKVREEMEGISRFTMHGPYNELFPCAIDRKARKLCFDRFLQAIDVARGYGIHKIVFHGGYNPCLYFPVWFREQSIPFFREFVKELPSDMTVCIENVLEEEPEFLTDILRAVDHPGLRMCLDVGHARAYSRVPPAQWIERASDVIDHFHIHNNDGTKDQHESLFKGVIPMEALLGQIEETCPSATLTLELPDAEPSLLWLREQNILKE